MADKSYNLKTGADSVLYYAREVTKKEIRNGVPVKVGQIESKVGNYSYPVLARQTGNSIKGSTESIESNELRKGRTRSAPRKGNSSAEGSLDFELSPLTFDDLMEAAFRGKWTLWTGDSKTTNKALKEAIEKSSLNFEDDDYCLATRCAYNVDSSKEVGFGKKKLFRYFDKADRDMDNGYDSENEVWKADGDTKGLFEIPKGSVIHELNCGEEDVKYMILREFGGVAGENLYQKFDHMAVSTISNDLSIGAIITGSVGFMGANDPKMLNEKEAPSSFDTEDKDSGVAVGEDPKGFVEADLNGKKYIGEGTEANPGRLPKSATQTDQFTTREGFLYLNGKNVEFANAMDWNLDNGLQKYYSLFVRNAIATTPLTLDITGNITTYLIEGYSDKVYNYAVDDMDNEILWCIEDNEDDPKYLYIFQIFKSKFTDHDASVNGGDVSNLQFPFQSFGEQAMRVLRVTLPEVTVTADASKITAKLSLDVYGNASNFAATVDGTSVADLAFENGTLTGTIPSGKKNTDDIVITYQVFMPSAEATPEEEAKCAKSNGVIFKGKAKVAA